MSISIERAQAILGPINVHGRDEVQQHFGVAYTPEQLAALQEIPFSEATLQACAGAYLLVAGAPVSLLGLRARHPECFYSKTDDWYAQPRQTFSREDVGIKWLLLRRELVVGSCDKTYAEQTALLGSGEEVPRACEVTFAVLLHFLATGERLFERVYVRCGEVDSDGHRVGVGCFDSDGFVVDYSWDGRRYDDLGLASSRKS